MRTNDLRKVRQTDSWFYDEDTELPCEIDRYRLNIHTLDRLQVLCSMLGGA